MEIQLNDVQTPQYTIERESSFDSTSDRILVVENYNNDKQQRIVSASKETFFRETQKHIEMTPAIFNNPLYFENYISYFKKPLFDLDIPLTSTFDNYITSYEVYGENETVLGGLQTLICLPNTIDINLDSIVLYRVSVDGVWKKWQQEFPSETFVKEEPTYIIDSNEAFKQWAEDSQPTFNTTLDGTTLDATTDIAFGNGFFVKVSKFGYISKSMDSEVWDKPIKPEGCTNLNSVCYGDGVFIAAGNSFIYKSLDGIIWTRLILVAASDYTRVQYCGGMWVIFRHNDARHVIVSSDTTTWNWVSTSGRYVFAVIYDTNNKKWIFAASDGLIISMDSTLVPDRFVTFIPSIGNDVLDVIYTSKETIIFCTRDGRILEYSLDGTTLLRSSKILTQEYRDSSSNIIPVLTRMLETLFGYLITTGNYEYGGNCQLMFYTPFYETNKDPDKYVIASINTGLFLEDVKILGGNFGNSTLIYPMSAIYNIKYINNIFYLCSTEDLSKSYTGFEWSIQNTNKYKYVKVQPNRFVYNSASLLTYVNLERTGTTKVLGTVLTRPPTGTSLEYVQESVLAFQSSKNNYCIGFMRPQSKTKQQKIRFQNSNTTVNPILPIINTYQYGLLDFKKTTFEKIKVTTYNTRVGGSGVVFIQCPDLEKCEAVDLSKGSIASYSCVFYKCNGLSNNIINTGTTPYSDCQIIGYYECNNITSPTTTIYDKYKTSIFQNCFNVDNAYTILGTQDASVWSYVYNTGGNFSSNYVTLDLKNTVNPYACVFSKSTQYMNIIANIETTELTSGAIRFTSDYPRMGSNCVVTYGPDVGDSTIMHTGKQLCNCFYNNTGKMLSHSYYRIQSYSNCYLNGTYIYYNYECSSGLSYIQSTTTAQSSPTSGKLPVGIIPLTF